jgi:hypothetical protein
MGHMHVYKWNTAEGKKGMKHSTSCDRLGLGLNDLCHFTDVQAVLHECFFFEITEKILKGVPMFKIYKKKTKITSYRRPLKERLENLSI